MNQTQRIVKISEITKETEKFHSGCGKPSPDTRALKLPFFNIFYY